MVGKDMSRRTIVLPHGKTVEYDLKRIAKKRYGIRINPDNHVTVSVLKRTLVRDAEAYIRKNEQFILRTLEKNERRNAEHTLVPDLTEMQTVRIFDREFRLIRRFANENRASVQGEEILFYLRDDSEEAQNALLCLLREKLFPQYVQSLCQRYYPQFAQYTQGFPKIRYRQMTRSWGRCCKTKNEIVFNKRLAQKPADCIEYVVVHEFCHFIHFDHSKAFWQEVEKRIPDRQQIQKKLNNQ